MELQILQWSGAIETLAMHATFTIATIIACYRIVINEIERAKREKK